MAHRWTNVYCRHWFKRIGTSQNAAIHEPAIQKDPWRKSFQRFVLTWLQCWRTKCIGGAILHSHFRAILDRWGRKTEQFCRGGEIADRCGEAIKWSRRQGPSGRNGTGAKKRYWRGCRNAFLCFVCMFIFCEGTVWLRCDVLNCRTTMLPVVLDYPHLIAYIFHPDLGSSSWLWIRNIWVRQNQKRVNPSR